jgi:SAM-dependent methyltransferase
MLTVVRKFDRFITVYQEAGLMGAGSRLLRRIRQLFGGDDPKHAEWLRQKTDADIEFDAVNGTATGGVQNLFELNIIGDNARHGVSHIASDPNSFTQLMRGLNIDLSSYSFVDLGSGKGRALMLAASFPFHRIVGVEFAAELHDAAQANLSAFAKNGSDVSRITLFLGDAASYPFPIEPLIIYLFNPFGSTIVRRVAENALASWRGAPRDVQILYMNPVHLSDFVELGWVVMDTIHGCARLVPR